MQKQSISRYEKSNREPNIRTAKILADALGIDLETLAPTGDGVFTESDQLKQEHELLISIYDQLPPESRRFLLAQLRGALQAQKAQDDLK